MNTQKAFAVLLVVTLFLSACQPITAPTAAPAFLPITASIGKISVEETLVESGPINKLVRVTTTKDFYNNDTVRVTNGGVAKLDFSDNPISIRLFNDTAVDDVKADVSGTTNTYIRMKLVFGGLSGEVAKNGTPVQFDISSGVTIYVLGTQFLVLYDPESATTYIANFDGTIAYSIPGQSVQFTQPGQLYQISPSFEISQSTLNFTRAEIEIFTSGRRSTLLDGLKHYVEPTATPTLTMTPTSLSPTPSATITPTPTRFIPCNKAAFVADITVPDGTSFSPGFQFTKTWRLRNAGTCRWTAGYSLVFRNGDQMGASTSINIPSTVAPGQTVDIGIGLVAPQVPGTYRGDWVLMSPSGTIFGVGVNGTTPVWVKIIVAGLPDLTVTINNLILDCPVSSSLTTTPSGVFAQVLPTPTPTVCTLTVKYTITNPSNVGVLSNFQVAIEVSGQPSRTITLNGLAAGGTQQPSEVFTCSYQNCGSFATVRIDSGNSISESNENNNISVWGGG